MKTDLCQFTSLKLTFIALTFTTIYHLYIRYINFISSKLTFIKLAVSTLHQTYPNLSFFYLDDKLLDRLSNLSLRLSDLSLKPISEMYLRSISSLSSFSSYPWGTWCTSGAFVFVQCCNAATVQRCVGPATRFFVSSAFYRFFFILSARLTLCSYHKLFPRHLYQTSCQINGPMKFIVKLSSVQLMSSDVVHQPWQSYLQPYSRQTWLFQTKFIKLIATYRHLSLSNSLLAKPNAISLSPSAYLSKCPFFSIWTVEFTSVRVNLHLSPSQTWLHHIPIFPSKLILVKLPLSNRAIIALSNIPQYLYLFISFISLWHLPLSTSPKLFCIMSFLFLNLTPPNPFHSTSSCQTYSSRISNQLVRHWFLSLSTSSFSSDHKMYIF